MWSVECLDSIMLWRPGLVLPLEKEQVLCGYLTWDAQGMNQIYHSVPIVLVNGAIRIVDMIEMLELFALVSYSFEIYTLLTISMQSYSSRSVPKQTLVNDEIIMMKYIQHMSLDTRNIPCFCILYIHLYVSINTDTATYNIYSKINVFDFEHHETTNMIIYTHI